MNQLRLARAITRLEKLETRETEHLATPNLYLGSDIDAGECRELAASVRKQGIHKVEECDDIEATIARLLADGEIVARVSGRMEFSARALGNRSILANASSYTVVRDINKLIKGATSGCHSLAVSLKSMLTILTLRRWNHSNIWRWAPQPRHWHKRIWQAGIHQYDHSARPQIVKRSQNPEYHRIISFTGS